MTLPLLSIIPSQRFSARYYQPFLCFHLRVLFQFHIPEFPRYTASNSQITEDYAMTSDGLVPETKVLAIASHVSLWRDWEDFDN